MAMKSQQGDLRPQWEHSPVYGSGKGTCKTVMLFDILDLSLGSTSWDLAGSSPAASATKKFFDIMELP